MDSKIGRFITFILKEKTRDILAFVFFILFLITLFDFEFPLILEILGCILWSFLLLIGGTIYLNDWIDKISIANRDKKREKRIKDFKLIVKEFVMFIPIWALTRAVSCFCQGQSANQTYLEEIFLKDPIYYSIQFIIIGPIIEEFIFRFLPYRFIKNRTLYVIISSIIFAAMHVIDDPNAFYYIWFYLMRPFYYAYRYHKTQDLRVPFCMHSFNNLIATIPMILSCF